VGCGLSCFVMNLIGVDHNGHPIGNQTTFSYACNDTSVNQEVEAIKRYVCVNADEPWTKCF
jgi:hypothetical protein